MGFRFRCSRCGRDHDTQSDSALTHTGGTLFAAPWYRDGRGVNHLVLVCLRCGALHDTYGSPAKALFGRALHVERVFSIDQLASPEVLANVDPPWQALWTLVDRGFLKQRMIEVPGVSGGPLFPQTSVEAVEVEKGIFAAVVHLAMYLSLTEQRAANDTALESFFAKAEEYTGGAGGTPFTEQHVVAANILQRMIATGLPKREILRRTQQILNEANK